MINDPFSSLFSLFDANVACGARMVLGGEWSFKSPAPEKIKLFFIAQGQCFIRFGNIERPIKLIEGDAFLFSGKYSYELASNPALKPVPVSEIEYDPNAATIYIGDGEETQILGAHIDFRNNGSNLLLEQIPDFIHLNSETSEANKAGWLITQLLDELNDIKIGSANSVSAILQILFIHLMRNYLTNNENIPSGWLRALGDKKIAPAIKIIHGEPSKNWGLFELAKECCMSRTSFAVYFKEIAGITPLAYLAALRIMIAERELKTGTAIQFIARKVGFSSESAFSSAFKRIKGISPKFYREREIANYR